MMEARQALEEYEAHEGAKSSKVHAKLSEAFRKATEKYLSLSSKKS